jgi:DedD protein
MATTSDDFHEIHLNGKQLVFLFMAVTVVSVVIFLCGVLVGRGVGAISVPGDPLVAQEATRPVADPPPVAAVGSGTPATAHEDLSYPNRLASGEQPREQLRTGPPPQQAAPNAPAATAPPARAQTQTASPPTPAPGAAASAPPVRGEPAGAGYAIQLAALRQRNEADVIARRLADKGYAAYVLTPDAGAPAVFRVRVGKFKDRREAESVAARLQKEEQFNPWIVR